MFLKRINHKVQVVTDFILACLCTELLWQLSVWPGLEASCRGTENIFCSSKIVRSDAYVTRDRRLRT